MVEGALIVCEGPPKTVATAFEAVVSEVGYARSDDAADLVLSSSVGERGVAFGGELTKTLAVALARRLARRARLAVRVLTARVVEGSGDAFECEVDDLTVRPDGTSRPGRWAADTVEEYGDDWGQICDGKAYFAVEALLDDARASALPLGEVQPLVHLRAPPSLGSSRLDALAKQVRLADQAALTSVAGRRCLRITTAGTTVTSFLEAPEADALRAALGDVIEASG